MSGSTSISESVKPLRELQKRWLKMARMNKEINCFINAARLKACANELAAILKELEEHG